MSVFIRKVEIFLLAIIIILTIVFWNTLSSLFSGNSSLYIKYDKNIAQNTLMKTSYLLRISDNEYIAFESKGEHIKTYESASLLIEEAISTDSLIEILNPKNLGLLKLDKHNVCLVQEMTDKEWVKVIKVDVQLVLEE